MEGKDPVMRLEWMAVRLVEVHRYFPEWADRVGLIALSSHLEVDRSYGEALTPPAVEAADHPERLRSRLRVRWRAWRIRRRELGRPD